MPPSPGSQDEGAAAKSHEVTSDETFFRFEQRPLYVDNHHSQGPWQHGSLESYTSSAAVPESRHAFMNTEQSGLSHASHRVSAAMPAATPRSPHPISAHRWTSYMLPSPQHTQSSLPSFTGNELRLEGIHAAQIDVPTPMKIAGDAHSASTTIAGSSHRRKRTSSGKVAAQTQSQPRGKLEQGFEKRKPSFFVVGQVFKAAIPEIAGQSTKQSQSSKSEYSIDSWGQELYNKPRAFVVVQEGINSCKAVPITSYGLKGVAKRGVIKAYHVIAYTEAQAPPANPNELPRGDERPMQSTPIRIEANVDWKLDEVSRMNLADPIKVEHYTVVKPVGRVHPESIEHLQRQYRIVSEMQLTRMPSSLMWTPSIPAILRTPDACASKTEAVREILRHVGWNEPAIRAVEMEFGGLSLGPADMGGR